VLEQDDRFTLFNFYFLLEIPNTLDAATLQTCDIINVPTRYRGTQPLQWGINPPELALLIFLAKNLIYWWKTTAH
jgi:hypothetical protein